MPSRKPATASNVKAVAAFVDSLRREQSIDTHGEALAALALTLAAKLDAGEPVMMTASWARELRQTLAALTVKVGDDSDDDDWASSLPAPVWDQKEP